jgi:hypothetical protein
MKTVIYTVTAHETQVDKEHYKSIVKIIITFRHNFSDTMDTLYVEKILYNSKQACFNNRLL